MLLLLKLAPPLAKLKHKNSHLLHLEDYLDDMDDYLTDKDEKEVDELISRLAKTSSVGKTMKLKGLDIEFTLRKEDLK